MPNDSDVNFTAQCPKGHGPTFTYKRSELKKSLENGNFQLFCITCGEPWYPSKSDIENLKRHAGIAND